MSVAARRYWETREPARAACLIACLLLCPASGAQGADDAACTPRVDTYPGDGGIRLRPHVDVFRDCYFDEPGYRRVLSTWLAAHATEPPPRSIALGRAVDYPWLSRALALAARDHPDWDGTRGKARNSGHDGFVGRLLAAAPIGERLAHPIVGARLVLVAVSVEKVLVQPLGTVFPEHAGDARLVPYDAQVWLRIAPAP